MRDYVFVPLGGFSRSNKLRSLRNVLVTLTIVGLWHGPRWTYVLCGLYIGVLLAIYFSVWRTRLAPRSTVAARVITFFSVTIGFVLFRSDTLSQAGQVFWALFGGNGFSFGALTWHAFIPLAILLTAATIASWMPNAWELTPQPTPRYAIVMASGLSLSMLFINASQPFLYFQF
jgi:alginate O-acetyltransferase complex protein AlgI